MPSSTSSHPTLKGMVGVRGWMKIYQPMLSLAFYGHAWLSPTVMKSACPADRTLRSSLFFSPFLVYVIFSNFFFPISLPRILVVGNASVERFLHRYSEPCRRNAPLRFSLGHNIQRPLSRYNQDVKLRLIMEKPPINVA